MLKTASGKFRIEHLLRPQHSDIEKTAQPSDGLVVFAAMWGFATMLSIGDRTRALGFELGTAIGISQWAIIFIGLAVIAKPRLTLLLGALAGCMAFQYLYRMPVPSNNQTMAFFMNISILSVLGLEIVKHRSLRIDRTIAYERLRVVARALLAVMYFYGIFHKINTDFLNPDVSCASALYEPLTRSLGLDQSIAGRYLAIGATFVLEGIALVCLFWRRYFWLGLVLGMGFHYVIPISGYSWYMDFSALVLALYRLSVPREVSAGFYSSVVALLRKVPLPTPGYSAVLLLLILLGISAVVVFQIADYYPPRAKKLLWHSSWLLIWAVVGGAMMVLITRAALLALPYDEASRPPQPLWLFIFPGVLFVQSLSPYLGLKTESSIAMFSNLHTEGGRTNHLVFKSPPYVANYQEKLVKVVDSSEPWVANLARENDYMVLHQVGAWLTDNPGAWITFDYQGRRYEHVMERTYPFARPSFLERKLLMFKPVDLDRPKVCTH
jgi:hypothetical protein